MTWLRKFLFRLKCRLIIFLAQDDAIMINVSYDFKREPLIFSRNKNRHMLVSHCSFKNYDMYKAVFIYGVDQYEALKEVKKSFIIRGKL